MTKTFLIAIIFLTTGLYLDAYADDSAGFINFTKEDKVLILAPHPDDEAIGTCGVIQKALKCGAEVKVVCYTNGDSNELSFIVYEKRLTFKKAEFLHMGEVRRRETMRAMVYNGVKPENIIFLGYPDFGTLEIFTKYWGNTAPYRGLFTKVSKVSYYEAMSVNAPYLGESILRDIKKVILDFKPTKIFVSHPADTNRDHKSLYLFLQVALWDIEGRINEPEILPYLVHVIHWPIPRGYNPDMELNAPDSLADSDIIWKRLLLTGEEVKKKHDTVSFYRSQIQYSPKYLYTFARNNELFGDFPVIRIKTQDTGEILWHEMKSGLDSKADPEHKKDIEKSAKPDIAYAAAGGKLCIRMQLIKKIEKDLGVSIFLIGYSKNTDFSHMPKMYIKIDTLGLHVRDKKQLVEIKDIEFKSWDNVLVLKIPFGTLGNPDRILTYARTHPNDLPLDESSWRVLYFDN